MEKKTLCTCFCVGLQKKKKKMPWIFFHNWWKSPNLHISTISFFQRVQGSKLQNKISTKSKKHSVFESFTFRRNERIENRKKTQGQPGGPRRENRHLVQAGTSQVWVIFVMHIAKNKNIISHLNHQENVFLHYLHHLSHNQALVSILYHSKIPMSTLCTIYKYVFMQY